MLKNLFVISLLLLFGCETNVDIKGHWHIKPENREEQPYLSMDVVNDTLAFIGRNSIHGPTEGRCNFEEGYLFFPGDCGYLDFEYEKVGEKLILKNYLENWIAEKCDSCCTEVEDFNIDLKIEIDFPQLRNNKRRL